MATLYLKQVILYHKKYICVLKVIFLYNLRAKFLLILFKLSNNVFCFLFLVDNVSTIKQQTILLINFIIFILY